MSQLELTTVIDHDYQLFRYPSETGSATQDTHKPAGVRLAKMLRQYDDQPSSQLWADIQRLAREILHASR